MTDAIWVAIITSGFTLLGVALQNYKHNKSISDLIEFRMNIIEKKQDKYNNVLERMMNIESSIKILDEKQKNLHNEVLELKKES